jgi:hypothetical protein
MVQGHVTLSLSPRSRVELQRSSPEMQPRVALLSCDLFKGLAAPALRGLGDFPFEGRNAVAGNGNEFPAITPGLVQHIDRITASRGVVQIELQIHLRMGPIIPVSMRSASSRGKLLAEGSCDGHPRFGGGSVPHRMLPPPTPQAVRRAALRSRSHFAGRSMRVAAVLRLEG